MVYSKSLLNPDPQAQNFCRALKRVYVVGSAANQPGSALTLLIICASVFSSIQWGDDTRIGLIRLL